jgi:integrase
MAAVVDPDGFGLLLRAIEDYRGSLVTRTALQLSALTFQRPGNLRAMKWADLQLEDPATWDDRCRGDEAQPLRERQRPSARRPARSTSCGPC